MTSPVNSSNLLKYAVPQIEIGEYVAAVEGSPQYNVGANTQSRFLKSGTYYDITQYPKLYEKIGLGIDLDTWIPRTVSPATTSAIYTMYYSNGLYLAGGFGGLLYTSTDTITWTSRTSGITSSIYSIFYGNGLYVYGAAAGIRTSTDAITWTARTINNTTDIRGITYGNGLFVYVDNGGGVGTSTDGITWTSRIATPSSQLLSVTYGNGLFVLGGTGGVLFTTTNGTSISPPTTLSIAQTIISLAYGNGLYIASVFSSNIFTSTDAITWTARTTAEAYGSAVYGNGVYLVSGGKLVNGGFTGPSTSENGLVWTSRRLSAIASPGAICYGNGICALGTSIGEIYSTPVPEANKSFIPTKSTAAITSYSNTWPTSTGKLVYYVRAK